MSLLMGTLAALAWGVHDMVVRIVSPRGDIAPLLFTALLAGTALLAPVALLADQGNPLPWPSLALALLAGLAFAAASIGLYRAFAIGPVRLVAPVCGSYPVLSLTIAAHQGRPAALWEWAAILAIVAGLALAASRSEDEPAGPRGQAILWALVGATGFALTFGLAQRAASDGGELTVTVVARLVALGCVGGWMILARIPLAPARAQWRPLVLVGALDATAISLVVAAARFPSPEYAAVTSSVFGLVTILLAWRFLGEAMRATQWLGVLIVFAGIAAIAT
ncbi:putative integral membrane protein [Rubellimicrobium mesophilum DSM 19309]|uniref:Putative integral membrane protein n=1 Tax=Rubellimicrobium mesophilum DSM 19309 TaxID=442562 RepID=A0A017HLA1_9RHOB|nr:DMT family transporter [Rubellimicrobium mesophilum]EYD75080.1 putative integral membrane protein [Rubellimicrobium mesophilum DSM 19309]